MQISPLELEFLFQRGVSDIKRKYSFIFTKYFGKSLCAYSRTLLKIPRPIQLKNQNIENWDLGVGFLFGNF